MLDYIEQFSVISQQERNSFLRIRSEEERQSLLEEWVDSEFINISDVLALDSEFQHEAVSFLCGSIRRSIPSSGKTFTVEPSGDPVELEIGSSRNKRKYTTISRKTVFPADRAIMALHMFGPESNRKTMRGKLREVLPSALVELRQQHEEQEKEKPKRKRRS